MSALLGADFYLHHKHGINAYGYRGPAVGRKQPGEKRVAVLGGSTTWGYGLSAGEDFPAQLERLLAGQPRPANEQIKILNLGANNEGAYSFAYTLNDYDYLDYDAVILYSGYNDLDVPNLRVFRHRSPVFVWSGYLPLLPILTADKIDEWQRSRENRKVVFQPFNPNTAGVPAALEKEVGQLSNADPQTNREPAAQCPAEWQFYCEHIYAAADTALKKGKRVLIVTEPYISDRHVAQQSALENMVRARFSGQRVTYLNLGRTVDLRDNSLCWDGMHLTAEGNRRVATALSQPVRDLLRD